MNGIWKVISSDVNRRRTERMWLWLAAAVSFSFPFGRHLTSKLLIIWVSFSFLFFVIPALFGKRRIEVVPGKSVVLLFLPTIFFLMNIAGIFYSDDLVAALKEVGKLISFLLLPAILYFCRDMVNEAEFKKLLIAYFIGMVAAAIVSLFLGFSNSIHFADGRLIFRTAVNDVAYERGDSFLEQVTQGGNYFFGRYISPFIHTTYYAMYLSFAALIAVILFFDRKDRSYLYLPATAILLIVMFFCDSKGALFSFLACIFLVSLVLVPRLHRGIFFPIAAAVIGLVVVFSSPRLSLMIKDMSKIFTDNSYDTRESTALRLIVWKEAIEVTKENLVIGVGTGDADRVLLDNLMSKNAFAYQQRLNAHNQYLQVALSFGIAGVCFLVFLLLAALRSALQNMDLLFAAFILIIMINMLFESLWQVFQGVQFFIFFYSLFAVKNFSKDEALVVK